MSAKKITVVGAGHVGATCSQLLSQKELAKEVVLVDIADGIPQGKGLDQWESAPIEGFDSRVFGASDYESSVDSDIFIVTAGIARKPGMSRDDLLKTNANVIRSVSREIARVAPDSIIIMVTNPLDVMAQVSMEASGFPRERVIGMAGVLDTARYRSFIALELDVSIEDIQALVLGGHGDTMVPLASYTSVSGIPLSQFLEQDRIDALVERTRKGGGEIVSYLKTGSAYYAPAAAAVQMAEAIVKDKRRILPCAAWLQGEYGFNDLYLGVPCMLGANGLERIIEVELEDFCLEGLGILGRNEPEHSGVRARHFKNLKNIIAELSAEHIDEFKLSFARIACEFPEGVVEKSGVVDIRLIEKLRLQVDEHLYVFNSKTSFWKWAFGDLRKRIWTGFLILIGATITAGFDWLIAYLE